MNREQRLTHLDSRGEARMVDVGDKAVTSRLAVARAQIRMKPETLSVILASELSKGDALATARIAAIQAAKKTSDLIPLCHPLPITKVSVELRADHALPGIVIEVICKVRGQTGIEMEALTAASVAALTVYDMAKSIDRGMVIEQVMLIEKSGGKTGEWRSDDHG
jgi:cyclic pyranopterin phosphate synthase